MGKDKKISVALYIRVSTMIQAEEGYSLEAQEKTLRAHAKSKGYEVVKLYSDEGLSGGNLKRPAMQQLLQDANKKQFNKILVWKLTRFTRNLQDLVNTCNWLDKLGIELESYSEGFEASTNTGKMVRNMLGVIAQWELEVISDNTRAGLAERAARGRRTCSQILGYDVVIGGGMNINEKESQLVKFIFRRYAEVKCLSTVSRELHEKGYKGKRGARLNPNNIQIILTRFVYCGFYNWNGKPIKGDFEPIISIDEYNAVQKTLKRQGRAAGSERKEPLLLLKEQEQPVE